MRATSLACSIAMTGAACGASEAGDQPGGGGGAAARACEPGEVALDDGRCLAAGVQPSGCAAGEGWVEGVGCLAAGVPEGPCALGEIEIEGGCQAAGVPPSGSAVGFEADGAAGCRAVLPEAPCPIGSMALPGETSCREVAPCGAGAWGNVPVEASTVYVDGAFAGSGDGSVGSPWTTIQEAIDAASPGALVAIAAGAYAEDLVVDKPLRLWGKCPAEVDIAGAAAALSIGVGADGSEVHDLAFRSDLAGIVVQGAAGVILERVWVHDTGSWGVLAVDGPPGDTNVTVRGSLVEHATEAGIFLGGVIDALVEDTAVRDTAPAPNGGFGIVVTEDEVTFREAKATVRRCLSERNAEAGVILHAAEVRVEATLIRDTLPNGLDGFGRALSIQTAGQSPAADVTVEGVVVERARDSGIFVTGSKAAIRNTVIRDVLPRLDTGERGNGIAVQNDVVRSDVTVRATLVERVSEHGLFLGGSDVLVEGVVVRDVAPNDQGRGGRGVGNQWDPSKRERGVLTLRGAVIDTTFDTGIFIEGSDALVENTSVSRTRAGDAGFGWGVVIQDHDVTRERSVATVKSTIVGESVGFGVHVVGSDATLERIVVRDTVVGAVGEGFGRGVNIQDDLVSFERSIATLTGSLIERNVEAGILVGGADAIIEGTRVRDTAAGLEPAYGGRGIVVQGNLVTGASADGVIRWAWVESNVGAGILVAGATTLVEGTVVRTTKPGPDDALFGDGLGAMAFGPAAEVRVLGSLIEVNSRAGVATFGSTIELVSSRVGCNSLDLTSQDLGGQSGQLQDGGNNACGCDGVGVCTVLAATLEAPEPPQIE